MWAFLAQRRDLNPLPAGYVKKEQSNELVSNKYKRTDLVSINLSLLGLDYYLNNLREAGNLQDGKSLCR